MGAIVPRDKGVLPATLSAEREELARLRGTLTPVVEKMADAIAKRGKSKAATITVEEDLTFRAFDRLVRTQIAALRADTDIARMDGEQVTQADLERFLKKVMFYVFQGWNWSTGEIDTELNRVLDSPQFNRIELNARQRGALIKAAQNPNERAKKRLEEILGDDTMMDHSVAAPDEVVGDGD